MSVDTIHPLLAGVFVLVWLLVWQILVRSQRPGPMEGEELAESNRLRPRRPYVRESKPGLQGTSQRPVH